MRFSSDLYINMIGEQEFCSLIGEVDFLFQRRIFGLEIIVFHRHSCKLHSRETSKRLYNNGPFDIIYYNQLIKGLNLLLVTFHPQVIFDPLTH